MTEEIRKYYNNIATIYDHDRFQNTYGNFIDTQEKAFLTKNLFQPSSNQKILDVGCGTGRLLNFANYGIDFSEQMLEIASKKFPNKKIIEGNATNIPFSDNYFDAIFSFHVIMHLDLETTSKFIEESYQKLKPNGLLIFDFPSKKRRKLVRHKSKNWHAANSLTIEEIKKITNHKWSLEMQHGLLFFPIHRIPKFARKWLIKLDLLICKSFLKEYASYNVIMLKKCS